MIQKFYRRHIMEKFMGSKELVDFDVQYQSVKTPTANNLGQKTFNQLVQDEVKKILASSK